jgi:hypothetical protein
VLGIFSAGRLLIVLSGTDATDAGGEVIEEWDA